VSEIIPVWYKIAIAELGVKEIPGEKDNPRITEYLSSVFDYAQHDEMPWCSAFVSWVMTKAGYESTHSALARSWLSYGRAVTKPERGDIIILERGSHPWQGHVGFFDGLINNQYNILGGNQGNAVSYRVFDKSRLLGIRRPL